MDFSTYERLGDEYLQKNRQAAFLCYENALYHLGCGNIGGSNKNGNSDSMSINGGSAGDVCEERKARRRIAAKQQVLYDEGTRVRKVSIIIVSYNCKYMMQKCVESIRKYCAPEVCELVVVDNASTDGVREWLCEQEDIKTILVDGNAGFPAGCNIGVSYAEPENDIFFLNNDTRLTPEALFFLRMGLYADADVGAVGCVANYCGNGQAIDVQFELPEEYIEYSRRYNVLCDNPFEEKNKLCGFAMLIKREAWNETSAMDEAYTPGYFDDDDLSTQIKNAGYTLRVCHNSYIYHAGSQSFGERPDVTDIIVRNYGYFVGKWGYDVTYHSGINEKAVEQLQARYPKTAKLKVLELGAGCGCTLSRIKYLFPDAAVCGVEEKELAVKYSAAGTNITVGDPFEALQKFSKQGERFDCIIFSRGYAKEKIPELFEKAGIRKLAEEILEKNGILIGDKMAFEK